MFILRDTSTYTYNLAYKGDGGTRDGSDGFGDSRLGYAGAGTGDGYDADNCGNGNGCGYGELDGDCADP